MLDGIFPLNITLDTLDGIITHNGEFEMHEYRPSVMPDFDAFDKMVEDCYVDEKNIAKIIPSTLEGCVVRVCDIIAYLGKDRQDATRAKLTTSDYSLGDAGIGTINAEIINNLEVNIIEHSYGKPYIMMRNALKSRAVNGNLLYVSTGKSDYFSQVEVKPGTIIIHI